MVQAEAARQHAPSADASGSWKRRGLYIGAVGTVALCACVSVMTGGKGQKVELQSIRVIHLPNGQIEMAYGGNQVATQTTRHGGGDYFPATAKFREGKS